jgi:murein DD-endopeptidase MepM/ murein hydrolase activator NlpD
MSRLHGVFRDFVRSCRGRNLRAAWASGLFLLATCCLAAAQQKKDVWPPAIEQPFRAVDLDVGQSAQVQLSDGTMANVRVLDLKETRDTVRHAVRKAIVEIEVNGRRATVEAAGYHVPITVGNVQIDCPVTKGCLQPKKNDWALDKAVRLRLWPAGAPWIQPGTFAYPVPQRWFVGDTQMDNEPVDSGCIPFQKPIYYHHSFDIGGAERLAPVRAATDAVVVSVGGKKLAGEKLPDCVKPRYDVVYLRDGRGWLYRYSHFDSIDPAVQLGARITMGQRLGAMGKEGGSGGWSHLHFEIDTPQPSGRFGAAGAYAFLWQAYHEAHKTQLQAVARPHQIAWTGEEVVLDGTRSWSAHGAGLRYEWITSDGGRHEGPCVTKRYDHGGQFSEILKVTDAAGNVDYDFASVLVYDREHPDHYPPTLHATYWPSENLRAGDEATFLVRSFRVRRGEGRERWDFGDGSPTVEVDSRPMELGKAFDAKLEHAKDGYAATTHRFSRPGVYLVSVLRANARGQTATARLVVRVAAADLSSQAARGE